ncbi:hypothetical protein [Actinomyces faecalis]|uniref:hypothetical protein n=1 Tax=Actinomyces faecalis TaxID=2722820 RepID=UPI001FD46A01|nr:hypothetical protein [Actinomyces faecalis]
MTLSAQPSQPGPAVPAANRSVVSQPAVTSRRMARRLLSGTGCASVTAYRYDGTEPVVVLHALDTDGRVLVAARPDGGHVLAQVGSGAATEVRLDVTLEAAEAGMRITTASAHLLGTLTWLADAEAARVLAGEAAGCHCPVTGEDPLAGLAALAQAPGGRLGVIETERVIVHDALGVSGHAMTEVLDPDAGGAPALLWTAFDEVSAQEEVGGLGDAVLDVLCGGVVEGDVPGIVCSHRPAEGLSPSLWDRVLCVDVAPDAVTLMRLGRGCVDTVLVPLPAGILRACQVAPALTEMVQDVLVERLLRP